MPTKFPSEDEDNAIASRKSDVFGEVRLYAPEGDPSEWKSGGFLLMTEHGEWKVTRREVERIGQDGHIEKVTVSEGRAVETKYGAGLKLLVRADRAFDAFERPSLLTMDDLWADETAEVEILL